MTDRLKRLRARVWELEEAGQLACALLAVRQLLGHNPDDANALLLQGRLLVSLARYGEAEESFGRALDQFAESSTYVVYRELGSLYETWGRLELALAHFEKAVALRPDDASSYIYAGGTLARLGRFDEAMAFHTKATQCAEGCIDEAYLNLGLILRALERFAEAKVCFERALELDPNYSLARTALTDVAAVLESQVTGEVR